MQFFKRTVLLENPYGDRKGYIAPMGSFEYTFTVPERESPTTHALLLMGEPDYFWKWRCEMGSPYSMSMSVDDALTKKDTYLETYALKVDCRGELYERNAWIKLYENDFSPDAALITDEGERAVLPEEILKGAGSAVKSLFAVPVKTKDLVIPEGEKVAVILEVYFRKEGRHVNDTFDEPDEKILLEVAPGTAPWKEISREYIIPPEACAMIINLHIGRGVTGEVLFGSPRLLPAGMDNVVPPLAPTQSRESKYNYVADNLSRRDHLEFACEIDGKKVFEGSKYTSILRKMDHELPLGPLSPGEHTVKFTFLNDYENAVGFLLQELDLLEYGNHDFELVAARESYPDSLSCTPVMIRTNKENVTISSSCGSSCTFKEPGLHVMKLSLLPEKEVQITLSSNGFSDHFRAKRVSVSPKEDDRLFLSTGDSIFIPREMEEMERFIVWYCANNVGNALCFRQSYRWGGCRYVNTPMWKRILSLLEDYGLRYSLMIDGRELPGCNANPPEELMKGKFYLGRQSHENDGAFYYWRNQLWKPEPLPEPYADLLAKRVNYGGIQPHTRPKRSDLGAWWFFDPYKAEDMQEAADYFITNLAASRGESTRHSGPSTLFRYFFQAGYDFLCAEQMYGPEELTLASLRAASKTYHAKGFGSHLAVQWSSTPHDTPEHAQRYFLALATCYIQGVTQINTEEGLWRMEKGYADYNRFSHNCEIHQAAHRKFREFMENHPREGKMVVPIACIQGRFDAWCGKPLPAWGKEGKAWEYGESEKSFELLTLFYPRSRIDWIYRCPCPVAPQGWYTGTPYGPVDLLPFEGEWTSYRAVFFLGWHTYCREDGVKMLAYVKNGGTLLLAKRHLSSSLIHNGEGVYEDDPALTELLGSWQDVSGISRRNVGRGKVIFFGGDAYPCAMEEEYRKVMAEIAEEAIAPEKEKLWAEGSEDINFAVYEKEDGTRTLYTLNINWWENKEGILEVFDAGKREKMTVPAGELLQY